MCEHSILFSYKIHINLLLINISIIVFYLHDVVLIAEIEMNVFLFKKFIFSRIDTSLKKKCNTYILDRIIFRV